MANRRLQIDAIQLHALRFAEEVDAVLNELEEALENMPASLRDSEKGILAQDRIEMLSVLSDALLDAGNEAL